MTKNPFFNAGAAIVYICVVVIIMNSFTQMSNRPSEFLAPLILLSVFTLSAAVMAYIFCYQPLQLYFDGKKKQAMSLFLRTVLTFGCFTAGILLLVATGVLS